MIGIAALVGPTAAGKSTLAMSLARRFSAEIVSVDSMQVYRGMDIGTAKPGPVDREAVPHHLIDIAEPEDVFTVAQFQAAGRAVIDAAAGRRLLLVGGSGLHFRALVDPLRFPPSDPAVRLELESLEPAEARRRLIASDPEAGQYVDLANPRRVVRALEVLAVTGDTPTARAADDDAVAVRQYRPRHPMVALGLDPGGGLADRVRARMQDMVESGLAGEVAALAPRFGPSASQAVGYRQLLHWHRGEWPLEVAIERATTATTALARRQRTFFRRDPRLRWLGWDDAVEERAVAALEEAGWSS